MCRLSLLEPRDEARTSTPMRMSPDGLRGAQCFEAGRRLAWRETPAADRSCEPARAAFAYTPGTAGGRGCSLVVLGNCQCFRARFAIVRCIAVLLAGCGPTLSRYTTFQSNGAMNAVTGSDLVLPEALQLSP